MTRADFEFYRDLRLRGSSVHAWVRRCRRQITREVLLTVGNSLWHDLHTEGGELTVPVRHFKEQEHHGP